MGIFRTVYRIAIVVVSWNGFSALATVYDSDGSPTNIQYIHDTLAQNGDTITIPAGTFTFRFMLPLRRASRFRARPQSIRILGSATIKLFYWTTLVLVCRAGKDTFTPE
jgi:hypothetical protein